MLPREGEEGTIGRDGFGDGETTCINFEDVGGTLAAGGCTGGSALIVRPHDGGAPVTRDGDAAAEVVIQLRIRRLNLRTRVPRTIGPGEDVGGTLAVDGFTGGSVLIVRPHDGGVPVTRDGDVDAEVVILLPIRRLNLRTRVPRTIGPREDVGGTLVADGCTGGSVFIERPRDEGVPVTRDGDDEAEPVTRSRIRCPNLRTSVPRTIGPGEYVDGTGVGGGCTGGSVILVRPHDGGVPVTREGDAEAEVVIRSRIRIRNLRTRVPRTIGPGEDVDGTGVADG